MAYKLFLSYTREKNKYNTVSKMKDRLLHELILKTGDKHLGIFQDTEITFGIHWEDKLKKELDEANCLIILLSPLWLNSEECNKEYFYFCSKSSASNKSRPVIPILFDEILETDILDDVKMSIYKDLKKLQIADWSDLKYESLEDTISKKALSKLAKDIKSILIESK